MDMSGTKVSEAPAPATTDDKRAIIRSIVGTGIGLATLLLMLAGLMIQQNANVNARFDDVNTRIGDVNARIDDVNANVNAHIDDVNANVNARFDDLQEDIRELRALIIDAIKGDDPAD